MLDTIKLAIDNYKMGELNNLAMFRAREFFGCLTFRKLGLKRLERLVADYYLYQLHYKDSGSVTNPIFLNQAIFLSACNEILSNGYSLSPTIKRYYDEQVAMLNF